MPSARMLPSPRRLILGSVCAALAASGALVLGASPAFADPAGLAPGTIITTSWQTDSLSLLAPDGTHRALGSGVYGFGPGGGGIALDAVGDVFVASGFGLDELTEIGADGSEHELYPTDSAAFDPTSGVPSNAYRVNVDDIAVNSAGTLLYMADRDNQRIEQSGTDGLAHAIATGFEPGSLAVDSAGSSSPSIRRRAPVPARSTPGTTTAPRCASPAQAPA